MNTGSDSTGGPDGVERERLDVHKEGANPVGPDDVWSAGGGGVSLEEEKGSPALPLSLK